MTTEELLGALEAHDWVRSRTWVALGLSSRDVLKRMMQKRGIREDTHREPER